jgi:hypothetical protein
MKGRSIFEPSRLKADRGAAGPDHRGKVVLSLLLQLVSTFRMGF